MRSVILLFYLLSNFPGRMHDFVFGVHRELLQLAAAPISSDIPVPSVDDLADQVAEILDFFG